MKLLALVLLMSFLIKGHADERADVMANDGEWTKVNIANNFSDPVVFAGAQNVIVGIRNVTQYSFEIRVHSCTGDTIGSTYISYYVAEREDGVVQEYMHDGC